MDLAAEKKQWKLLVAKGELAAALLSLIDAIPEGSTRYNEVISLQNRQHEANKKSLKGILSDEQLQLAYNRIREDLLTFIDLLSEKDFKKKNTEKEKGHQQGHVLYRIPKTMELHKAARCHIRIALDKDKLVENIDLTPQTKLQDIRVSDTMQVELIDPNRHPFKITSFNEPIQLVAADDYTEWIFFVKPTRPGIFPLMLKVSIIEIVNGKPYKREKVLEENVEVVTFPQEIEENEEHFRNAGYAFSFVSHATIQDNSTQYSSPSNVFQYTILLSKLGRAGHIALILVALFIGSTIAWAIAPQEIEWWITHYLMKSEKSYERYIEKFPESRHIEEAIQLKSEEKNKQDPSADSLSVSQSESRETDVAFSITQHQDATDTLASHFSKKEKTIQDPSLASIDTQIRTKSAPETASLIPEKDQKASSVLDTIQSNSINNIEDSTTKEYIHKFSNNLATEEPLSNIETDEENTILTHRDSLWVRIKEQPSSTAIREYLTKFPNSPYLEDGLELLAELEKGVSSSSSIEYDQIRDRDGNIYKTVIIDEKEWLVDNLNVEVIDGSWFYHNNPAYGKRYGRLYTWQAANYGCAQLGPGWRLPSDEEWRDLLQMAGGYFDLESNSILGRPSDAFHRLVKGGSGILNFTLGGIRTPKGEFAHESNRGIYWSDTEADQNYAWNVNFAGDQGPGRVGRFKSSFLEGLSCRCVKEVEQIQKK